MSDSSIHERLDRIEALLLKLTSGVVAGRYVPTKDDEAAAAIASEGGLRNYLMQKAKAYRKPAKRRPAK